MKILVVCQYYYPENFQVNDICEGLVKLGYNVTVLTGLPNYPTGIIPDEYKDGKNRRQTINGVKVLRCFEIPRKKGAIGLALNYMSFCISSILKVNDLDDDFDIVFVYQLSPVLMGLAGRKYSRKYNVPLFLYCLDLWPESVKMYIKNESNPIFRFANYISRKVYESADKISVQSKSFIDYMCNQHNIKRDKIEYIPAFADESYLAKDFEFDNGVVDFVFLGNIGIAQNLDKVLDAVIKIKHINDFKLHIVGDGVCLEKLQKKVKENKLDELVKFYGRRPVEEMGKFYKLADACIVSLKADNLTGLTLPAKVQGYMAAGKPIIGMINGSARDVIEEAKAGICVDAGDVDAFANALMDFIEHKARYKDCGKNGRKYFIDNFRCDKILIDLEKGMKELIESYNRKIRK